MSRRHKHIYGFLWLALVLSVALPSVSAEAAESTSYRLIPGTAESRPNRSLSSPSYSLRERTPSLGAVALASLTYRIVSALPPRFILPDHPPPEGGGWSDATGTVRNMAGMRQVMAARMATYAASRPQLAAPAPTAPAPQTPAPPVMTPPAPPGVIVPPTLPPRDAAPLLPPKQAPMPGAPLPKPDLHFAPSIERKDQRQQQRRDEKSRIEQKKIDQQKHMEQRKTERRELRGNSPALKQSKPVSASPNRKGRIGMRFGAGLSSLLLESPKESPFAAVTVTSLISFALIFFLLRRRTPRC